MANEEPDQSEPTAPAETDNTTQGRPSNDAPSNLQQSETNRQSENNRRSSVQTEVSGTLNVPTGRRRGESLSNRISERVRGVLSGGGTGIDRTTSTTTPRPPARRGTESADDVAPVTSITSRTSRDGAFAGGRSKTVSARGNAPKPGDLRRSETRQREEEWARTMAMPPTLPPTAEVPQGNSNDTVGELPTFRRSNTNNFGQEMGSLRRRGTAMTSGRPRGDSVRSRVSIQQPARPGEAGPDPAFSLAGPGDAQAAALPFVERGYAVLNPAYDQPLNARPVWGLAKPLPRVVRPGMVPSLSELNNEPDLEANEPRQKANRAWDLALAAARARRGRRQSQTSGLQNEGGEQQQQQEVSPSGRPDGLLHPPESSSSVHAPPPPIPEHPDEDDELEPFPDVDSSMTEVHDEYFPELDAALAYGEEIHNHHTHWSVIRSRYREPLAELLAVMVQLTLGFSADLAVTVSSSTTFDTTAWAWGLATMVGIYIAGGISGAHLNPAISITLWIYRGFPLRKIPPYVFAQVLGGFLAALIAFGIYKDDIMEFGGVDLIVGGTANDFVTSRRYSWVSIPTAFFNEFVGTAFLAVAVLATGDDSNAPPGAGMNAFILGLIVTVISMAFGHNTGAACNPSRDFGPRLALLALGYGNKLFTDPYWFYGPWVACISGAIFGAAMYDIAIFTGGESPINYPSYKMKRAARKWRIRMDDRVRRLPGKFRNGRRKVWGRRRGDGYEETEGKLSS